MTNPQRVVASIEEMRSASKGWTQASHYLVDAVNKTAPLQLSGLQAGIFQLACDDYVKATNYISDRLQEGVTETANISFALFLAASNYEREDQEGAHDFTHIDAGER
ncbi:type VII secretion target [Antrihabitans stalactiti]|nr:type VII secretion target [Antrihabitans stalactiti]